MNIDTPTTISNVSGNANNAEGTVGVLLENLSNITLENLSLNRIGGDGVEIESSYNIKVMHSKIKAEESGLLLSNSHDIKVISNEFTYNCYYGLTILNSYNILVQYTKTNANDTGGILVSDNSHGIWLFDGVSSGNGPLCRTESGIKTTSGEVVDTVGGLAIVNGAYDITVSGYTLRGNTHYDLMFGGDGLYPNPCTGINETVDTSEPAEAPLCLSDNNYGSGYYVPDLSDCSEP